MDDTMASANALRIEDIAARFAMQAKGPPGGMRTVAAWLAERPEELAFHTVRGLAERLGCDPGSVMRCVRAAGFGGYAEARESVRNLLRLDYQGYRPRVEALRDIGGNRLLDVLQQAAGQNVDRVFSSPLRAEIEALAPDLLAARRVFCVGVRMAYALAHLFTYRGAIAHANIQPAPNQPGLILDQLIDTGPQDIVLVISFAHYSDETLRAARVARARKARVVAITDRADSPLAEGAWRVLRAPVEGPHVMHSLIGAATIIETLLELMLAQDPGAAERMEGFERSLLEFGAYAAAVPGAAVRRRPRRRG